MVERPVQRRPADLELHVRDGLPGADVIGGNCLGVADSWSRTRIGGVLRVESEVVNGANEDHVYHLRTFTPSLSLVVLSHFAG